jgi:uncharacterized membrane protein
MIFAEKMKTKISTNMIPLRKLVLCLILVASLLFSNDTAQAQNPIVRAILFYSSSCPHCHQVITQDLPPLVENYQEQLYILAINTSTPEGSNLFQAAINYYNIPPERQGVPMLIVGDGILVGSFEIPDQFPYIINDGLAQGGIDWPDLPQLLAFLKEQNLIATEEPINLEENNSGDVIAIQQQNSTSDNIEMALENIENMTVSEKFAQDKVGNSISVLVLVGMILVVGSVIKNIMYPPSNIRKLPLEIAPILIVIGLCVAIYMGYVEITQTEAICGPVGDCNTVQQSSYAFLFGIIPIGALGVVGYLVITLTWLIGNFGPTKWRKRSTCVFFALTLFGTIFSIYLTFLEPFVIGASCAWCLTSAVVMTLLLMYSRGYTFALEER